MKKQIKVAYFPSTATKSMVLGSNGKSLDKYCTKCETNEDLSTGNYILDATFLIEDNLQDLLQEEVILKVLMDYGEEFFRISKPTVGTRYITIVARQITIAEELTLWLEDVRPTTMSGANASNYLVSNAIGIKEIQVVSNISNVSTAYYQKMTLYQALHDCDQSFLNNWGGEIQRRGYIEYINSFIGISRGVTIREGKNLTGFECTSNIDNLVTRAQGKGFDGIVGNYIDSPLINSYNRVYTDVIEYSDVKVKGENSEEGYDTLAQAQTELNRRIQAEYDINGIDKIKASYAINFVQLEKTEEYKNYIIAERVYLGDTIGVYVPKLNTDIKVRAMIKKFDILAQKTIEITLSNYIEVKPLSIKQIIERLAEIGTKDDILQLAKDNATVLIKAGIKNSYVTVRENEIIIGDTKDINTMTKVWRWNNGGLGYSSTGYYGTFGTAITSDGNIVGSFIEAKSISALAIKTDELIVGDNIAMGPNAVITWDNLSAESQVNLTGVDGINGLDGVDGTTGLQGLQGETGDTGLQGINGFDGAPSYTHIAYSTSSTGSTGFSTSDGSTATYIGMYVDDIVADSVTASMYTWSLIAGADGANGINGTNGINGLNSYLHIAYATSSNGSVGFSTTVSTGKTYIGQYTDSTLADSTNYAMYSWSLIQGATGNTGSTGSQGIQGIQGIQGDQANLPAYITSTKITQVAIESPTITAGTIIGSNIVAGGANNGDGNILVKDGLGNTGLILDKDGITMDMYYTDTTSNQFLIRDGASKAILFRITAEGELLFAGVSSFNGDVFCNQGIYGLGRKPAYSWWGTVARGGVVEITHNLGYYPIVSYAGTLGTFIMNINNPTTIRTSIFNASGSSTDWTGRVLFW